MGLISPGGENLLDFIELRQVLSTYDGDLRDPLWWALERPVPCELLGGLWECGTTLEFLSPFLWRAPPLEMRRERWEFFPDHAGKGSLLSS